MQLVHFNDHGIRRFMLFWGALITTYVMAVLYRLIALHQEPQITTFAALSALLAVWLEALTIITPRSAYRLGVIASVVAVVTLNVMAFARSIATGTAPPVMTPLITIVLLVVLVSMIRHEVHRFKHKEKE